MVLPVFCEGTVCPDYNTHRNNPTILLQKVKGCVMLEENNINRGSKKNKGWKPQFCNKSLHRIRHFLDEYSFIHFPKITFLSIVKKIFPTELKHISWFGQAKNSNNDNNNNKNNMNKKNNKTTYITAKW